MKFDTKLAVILKEDLQVWQKLNITAFLMSGIGGTQNIIGQPYIDDNGVEYLPMSRQPIMIYSDKGNSMINLLKKAFTKEVVVTIYTEELFNTFNDDDNREMVSKFKTDEFNLVGIGIYGKKNHVDKLLKGFELHK